MEIGTDIISHLINIDTNSDHERKEHNLYLKHGN